MSWRPVTQGRHSPAPRPLTMTVAAPYRFSVGTGWCLGVLILAVHAGWLWSGNRASSPFRHWSSTVTIAVVLLLSAGVIGLRCVAVRHQRAAWALVCLATALSGLGYLVYGLVAAVGGLPTASLADVLWFPTMPLLAVGIWLLARPRVGGVRGTVFVGAASAALLSAAVLSAVLGQKVLDWNSDGLLAGLVNLYYPAADMVVLGSITAIALLASGRLGRTWGLISAAALLFVVADTWAAKLLASGDNGVERLDPLWATAGLLLALAAWQPPRQLTHRPVGRVELVAPLAGAALAVLVLLVGPLLHWTPVASGFAATAAGLALLRMALGMRSLFDAAEYHRLALTDDLTGVYNRRGFLRGVEEALAGRRATAGMRVVLLLGLDRFKEVNDGLGHETGDRVLAAVAVRLTGALTPDDLLARLGGDEFAVLTTVPAGQGYEDVVHRLRAAVRQPLQMGRITLPIDVSVGVALESDAAHGSPEGRALALLRCADIAMYRAKADLVDWSRYDPLGSDRQRDALELAGELRVLLTEVSTTHPAGDVVVAAPGRPEYGWLELHYQPLAAVSEQDGIRAEALIRWVHPRYGMVMPDRFVMLAEQIGLMPYLTRHVLALALDQAARWRAAGSSATISVNLGASDLASPTLMDEVLDGLSSRGLPPEALTVEITEQTAIGDLGTGRDALAVLRRAGLGVAIDDFGTGYSALSYLQRLPATELKLDMSLTARVVDDPAAAAIVHACVELAHTLGLEVVAEGVETPDQAEALVDGGCDWLQGWLYGRPAPAGPQPPAVSFSRRAPEREGVPAHT